MVKLFGSTPKKLGGLGSNPNADTKVVLLPKAKLIIVNLVSPCRRWIFVLGQPLAGKRQPVSLEMYNIMLLRSGCLKM